MQGVPQLRVRLARAMCEECFTSTMDCNMAHVKVEWIEVRPDRS